MTDAPGDRRGALAFVAEMIAHDVLTFGDFVLKSGRRSPYFFNLGAIADGAGLDALGSAYAATAMGLPAPPEVVFGPAYKGIPIAVATAIALAREHGRGVGAAFNRKEAKTHGEGGMLVGASLANRHVVIVDDVVTDGTAKREAVELVTAAGGTVVGIVLALDRQEPAGSGTLTAVQALGHSFGVPVRSVATLDDVQTYLGSDPRFADQHRRLTRYRASLAQAGDAD